MRPNVSPVRMLSDTPSTAWMTSFGERVSVSRQTINAVETDKYDPSLPLALRMAKLFAVPVDQIFLDHWEPEE